MTLAKKRGRAICAGLACLALAGCSGGSEEVSLETLSAEQIYALAESELERGRVEDAAEYFGEVERLYPYSDWAKRALIMQAFVYHQDEDYEESRASAQRYIEFYPADEDAAYAQYLLALSYYDQIDEIGRDQGITLQALQELRVVIERYPESEWARSSMLKFDLAFDHLAGKEMEVGRYYLKRQHHAAAISRFRAVVENYQTTTHAPEALYRLVEAYLIIGLEDEAQTAGAILGHNFRSSVWYSDAYALLTGNGLRAEVSGDGWLRSIYRQTVRGEWL